MLNLDYRRRSDRIKLFLIIFGLCSLVSLVVVYLSGGSKEPQPVAKQQEAVASAPTAASETKTPSHSPGVSAKRRSEVKTTLSQSVLDETKETARKFAEAYYTYDPKQPAKYVEDSKPYMAEKLYVYEKNNIRRQTLDHEKTTAIRSSVLPVDSYDLDELVWCVVVEGKVTPAKGSPYTEQLQYFVTLRKSDDEWKVREFTIEEGGE